jgi:diguanylate cyclase (GGDEF)-like protein/PAS domain S-box-containing protein
MDADLFVDAPPQPRASPWAAWRRAWSRWRPSVWLGTLKARLAVGMLVGLLLGMSVTAWQLTARAERGLLQQAQLREQREARAAAAAVGRRLAQMRDALVRVGDQLEPAMLDDAGRLARLFERQPLLRAQFSNVFAADATGRVLVHVDGAGARHPAISIGDGDDFQRAMREWRSVISTSLTDRVSDEPVAVVMHPVAFDDGRVALIGGALRLASQDLLQAFGLRDLTPGGLAPGEEPLLVLADADGRVLSHPHRGRLLTALADEPRLAGAFGQWVAHGRPPAADPARWSGRGDLVAMAVDPVTGWQVWRAVPESVFLEALRDARTLALRDAALLAAAIAVLLAAFLAWQLRPLAQLERRAAAMLTGGAGDDWPEGDGEIGRLARTLRHVWVERTQVEAFNAEVLRKLGSVMAAAPVGLAFTRAQCFELVSDELCHLLCTPPQQLLGRPTQSIFVSNEDFAALGRQVGEAFGRGRPYSGEWPILRADGTRFWGLLRARPVTADDPQAGTIWSVTDVSEQVAARRALEHAALHDALTGVVNRQGFEQALQAAFDGQPGTRPTTLVMLDLDHFKPINDTAGHAAGDAMLVAVAQAIASRVRATDTVVRLGGDEFALLLPHCDHERALEVAEKVREAIADLALTWEAHTLRVGASLGVAELAEHHESAAQWLAQADAACYDAKRAGRGTVRLARGALRAVVSGGG